MKRHRPDPLSAALGVVVVLISIAVMLRRSVDLVGGGPWWLALGALVIGLGLIPWRRTAPATTSSGEVSRASDG